MVETDYSVLFSRQAGLYAQFRPTYPPEWFAFLAGLTVHHERALDCATGSGQAVPGLAQYYRQVIAADPSLQQLAYRQFYPRSAYLAARAEALPLPPASVDLITAAQAAHWFDMGAFARQARRVLRPAGVVAVWCYEMLQASPEIDAAIWRFYREITGPYWSPRRKLLEEHYRTLPFPFDELPAPEFAMHLDWNLENMLGFLNSWSATQDYIQANGANPLALIQNELLAAWGDPVSVHTVHWPVYARVGRI